MPEAASTNDPLVDVTHRSFDGWDDVVAVHDFLAGAMGVARSARIWEVRRWEGRWWHDDPDAVDAALIRAADRIRIWEDGDGDIVAVAHPEGDGDGGDADVHLQLLPQYADLEDDMLAWAEDAQLSRTDDRARTLLTFCLDDDAHRIEVLTNRGYEKLDWGEIHRWRRLDDAPTRIEPAPGYSLRALAAGDRDDAAALADLINTAFGHHFGPEALLNFERSPSYLADCQIVAVAPDGTHAAHAGVTVDTRNALAVVEPVCTHPAHRRLGLAGACISAGLERAMRHGARWATVSTGTGNPSDLLYERLGFTDLVERADAWRLNRSPRR